MESNRSRFLEFVSATARAAGVAKFPTPNRLPIEPTDIHFASDGLQSVRSLNGRKMRIVIEHQIAGNSRTKFRMLVTKEHSRGNKGRSGP
jgi:hypothetical protein